jgi:Na+/H+ antiporter NhaC
MKPAWKNRLRLGTCLVLAVAVSLLVRTNDGGAAEPPAAPAGETGAGAGSPIEVVPPPIAVRGAALTFEVRLSDPTDGAGLTVELRSADGSEPLAQATLAGAEPASLTVGHATADGRYTIAVRELPSFSKQVRVRTLAGWTTLLPPLVAIVLALIFRQVIPALVAGIWIGASIRFDGILTGTARLIDHYVVRALADTDHVSIVVFSLLLGGMVGIVSRGGGTHGLVEALAPYATTSRRGQLVTWLLGILVFFDDYANTLLVGNTMRPVTDRLRISREKLAYIVDSTAAPVASIALVSTWIGYEVSLIADSLRQMGIDQDAYGVFLRSLPYNFYPFMTLGFGLMIAGTVWEFGPMLAAERRALGGKVLGDAAVPLSEFDGEVLSPAPGMPRRWYNAVVPILGVLVVTCWALWRTGRSSLTADGDPAGTASILGLGFEGLGTVFGAGNSFQALLWGSLVGCICALALTRIQGILTVSEGMTAWIHGVKSMTAAIVILVLAWSIADICSDLNTSEFMVAALSDRVDPRLIPAIVFVLAAITAFSTGTSWGTMGILIPLAVPTAFGVATSSGFDAQHANAILLCSISAVLAGAIFGDHCSPISDTTVLSSMASGCDHVDHVRTQLPYALLAGLVALATGYVPAGFGVPPLLCLAAGMIVLAVLLRVLGHPVRVAQGA